MKKIISNSVGVIPMRLQTPYPHNGHLHIMSEGHIRHQTLCIVLGYHDGIPNDKYPLDLETRTKMVLNYFPEAVILSIMDNDSNEVWSKNLDKLIEDNFDCEPNKIKLYGSRDSFIKSYHGKFEVREVFAKNTYSATEIRERECMTAKDTPDFRAGAIYSALTRFPIVLSTIDIAPYRIKNSKIEILLGQKISDGGKYCFIGGFADPQADTSFEDTALRELAEESSLKGDNLGNLEYIRSHKVDDVRCRGSKDTIITTLFVIEYRNGEPKAKDDLDDVHWVNLEDIVEVVRPNHIPSATEVKKYLMAKFGSK